MLADSIRQYNIYYKLKKWNVRRVTVKRVRRVSLLIVACVVAVVLGVWLYRFGKDTYNIRVLRSAEPKRRLEAIAYLGNHRVSRAVSELISVMNNKKDFQCVTSAMRALGQIGTREAVDALISEVEGVDTAKVDVGSFIVSQATMALFTTSDERAVPALLHALESKDSSLRRGAAIALSKFGRKEFIPELVEALETCNSVIDSPGFRAPLEEKEPDPFFEKFIPDDIGSMKSWADYCASKLREFTGQSFGYNASENKESRTKAVEAWENWLKSHHGME